MKRSLVLSIFLLLLSTSVFGNVRLAFDSTSLDFGLVSLTGSKSLVLEVWDTSSSDIQVDRLTVGGLNRGEFVVSAPSPTPFVVPAGATHTKLTITFHPQGSGLRTASLLIQTTDGTVSIPLSGIGGGKSSLKLSVASIDFGKVSPGVYRDSIIELYSTGADTATVAALEIVESDTSFMAEVVSGEQTPFMLAPGDSVAVRVSFSAPDLLGQKDGQLVVFGATQNSPSCTLTAIDSEGSFAILPDVVNFGVMYAGEVRDTIVTISNLSDVDIALNDIEFSPADAYTVIGPLQLPYIIRANGEMQLAVRANPGYKTANTAQLQVLSKSSSPNYHTGSFTTSVIRPPLSVPSKQALAYFCATKTFVAASIPIADTGARAVTITGISAGDSSIALTFDKSLPDTLPAAFSQTLTVYFDPAGVKSDTVILYLMGGGQVMMEDTLLLQSLPSKALTSVIATAVQDSVHAAYDVRTATDMTAFDLSTIIVHLNIDDPNVATIDKSSIALAPGLSGAHISSIQPDASGYAVTIVSSSPIASPSGSSLLTFNVTRYISIQDSSFVTAQIESPEKAGCLDWTVDTSSVAGAGVCGSGLSRAVLNGRPMILGASLAENPVQGSEAKMRVTTSLAGPLHLEVADDLGVLQFSQALQSSIGINEYSLGLRGLSSGAYMVRISSPNGSVVSLRLLKLH